MLKPKSKNKKVDLLAFQENLNAHFMDIFESKKNGEQIENENESANLGIEVSSKNILFFFPLQDLRNISIDLNFEKVFLTKPWLLGFNQLRGEVFTIIDWMSCLKNISGDKSMHNKKLSNDGKIAYIKDILDTKLGFYFDNLKLSYTAELTPVYNWLEKEEKFSWKMHEGVEFDSFIKKENMSEDEWMLMENIHELIKLEKLNNLDVNNIIKDMENETSSLNNLIPLFKDVYLDAFGKRPIFVINMFNLTKLLINVSPY